MYCHNPYVFSQPLCIVVDSITLGTLYSYLPTIPTFPVIYRNLGVTPDIPGICTNIPRFYAFGCRVLVHVCVHDLAACELNVMVYVLLFGANRPRPIINYRPYASASMRNAQLIAGTGVPDVYTYTFSIIIPGTEAR